MSCITTACSISLAIAEYRIIDYFNCCTKMLIQWKRKVTPPIVIAKSHIGEYAARALFCACPNQC
jgi:hypothetical protein